MLTTNGTNQNLRMPRLAGWGLIVLAFAIPAFGFVRGAYDDVELVVTLMGAVVTLLVVAGVAWLITLKLSLRTKVYGRVAVGLLLCLNMSAKLSNDIRDHDESKAYAVQLAQARHQHAAFAEVLQRYEHLDLSEVLTPTALTTAHGIANGRAAMARYHRLLAERQTLLNSLVESMDRAAAVSPDLSNEATRGPAPVDVAVYASFDAHEPAVARAMDAILDWASAQQGRLKQHNGEYVFANASQEAEMDSLLASLDEAKTALAKAHAGVLFTRMRPEFDDLQTSMTPTQAQQTAQ